MQVKKQQLELDMEQQTGSKLAKEYIKAVYCHPAYLTYVEYNHVKCWDEWSTSWNQFARGNINNLKYADDTTIMAESEEELKSLLMKVKEDGEKVGLRPNIEETKIMASGPITSWQINRETMETVRDFILGGSEITSVGDCSHEIKRCLLLDGKLWQS